MRWGSLALRLKLFALFVVLLVFVTPVVQGFTPFSRVSSCNTVIVNRWKSPRALRGTSEVAEGARIANSEAGRETEFDIVSLWFGLPVMSW